jgi:transcriptional regulator of acetoin/glycerol metabolism
MQNAAREGGSMLSQSPATRTAADVASPQHLQAIAQSHARCAALGLDESAVPELNRASAARLQESRERHRRLHEQATPVMELLFEQIASSHSMVALTDPNGGILHSLGDDSFLERAQQVALSPGVNWSEPNKGTNAVGTALFTEAPTLVHGDEHFLRAHRFLTCSAAPIFDHAGRVMGVLDVSGDQRSYHPHTLALVDLSARMIENQCFADRFRNGLRLHFHAEPACIGTVREGLLAVDPDGAILGANRSALAQLGLSIGALRMLGLEGLLGLGVGAFADHGRRHGDAPLTLRPVLGPAAGAPLHVRAVFQWPVFWSAASLVSQATLSQVALPAGLAPASAATGAPPTLEALETDAIRRAVAAAGGNVSLAARQLGVARNTVYRRLKG